ncbi:MAG TPA: chemotaxis protein CheD [Candidatus Saccharimonadales bacterium]|jgi:chemotaxis protein CheD|nr:chemotaxis protein CheD [Candidatus Saccharimonadales bacterium]
MSENALSAQRSSVWQAPDREFVIRAESPEAAPPEVYLHPGENYVADSPVVLKMILGSCAGVFLFDPILAIGGATHYMLPRHGDAPPSPRYGDAAMARLLERFRTLGSNLRNVQAKVFGGAAMLQALENLRGSRIGQIGVRNIETAFEILERESIPIAQKDVFGNQGRKVSMVSNTGKITLEIVSSADGDR